MIIEACSNCILPYPFLVKTMPGDGPRHVVRSRVHHKGLEKPKMVEGGVSVNSMGYHNTFVNLHNIP